MAHVRFIADFDYRPSRSTTIAYRKNMELIVKRECADQAIAAGKAFEIPAPGRSMLAEAADGEATGQR